MANYSYNFKINWYEDHDMYSSFSVDKLSGSYRYVSRYSDMCMGVSPRVEPGHPSSPLVHLLPHLFPFLLFPFFHWLYLFFSFVHPFPFYQNSPTPFPGQRS